METQRYNEREGEGAVTTRSESAACRWEGRSSCRTERSVALEGRGIVRGEEESAPKGENAVGAGSEAAEEQNCVAGTQKVKLKSYIMKPGIQTSIIAWPCKSC